MILARLLRFVFRLLYHRFAWTYDFVAWAVSAGQWKDWVFSSVKYLGDADRILEIGHGPGHLQERLLRAGRRVTGIDLSPQMGWIARSRLGRLGLAPQLARADALRLPFAEADFDALVATFPAEYIADPAAWRSFARVLRPGGRVVVVLGANPLGRSPFRILSRVLFRLTRQKIEAPEELLRTRFVNAVADTGLEVEFISGEVNRSVVFYIIGKKGFTTEPTESTE